MIGDRSLSILHNFFFIPSVIASHDYRHPGIMSFKCIIYNNRKVFNLHKINGFYDGYISRHNSTKKASTFISALRYTRMSDSLTEINIQDDKYFISCSLILNSEYKPLVIYTSDTDNHNAMLYVSPRVFDKSTKVIEKGIMKFLPEYCAEYNIPFIISKDIDNFIEYTKIPTISNFSDDIWKQIKDNSELYSSCKNADIKQLL